ncbi:MAG TPA: hypothetical protein VL574_00405, partial [Stellaceae bacterium]|nr:hypothetical protein [Stellaceae bacterium]
NDHLVSLDPWFAYLENFRHALAHRVPIYVPPSTLTPSQSLKYQLLSEAMAAAGKSHQHERFLELAAEREALGTFSAVMLHSFQEGSDLVYFHGQMLEDFKVIDELATAVLRIIQMKL